MRTFFRALSFTAVATALTLSIAANAQTTRPTTKTELRNTIISASRQTFAAHNQPMRITSTDRTSPHSAAHDRGAIDVAGTDHSIARDISSRLGRGYTAIVEQPKFPPCAPGRQMSSSYRNGQPVRSTCPPLRATGPHTHIQPDSDPHSDAPHRAVPVCADCGRSARDFGSEAAFQKHLAQGHRTKVQNSQVKTTRPPLRYPTPRPNAPTPHP